MIKFFLVSFFSIFGFTSTTQAVMMDEFSTTGVVKSFDQKTVTLDCQARTIQVPRQSIQEKNFTSGQTVRFTLNGKQVTEIFFAAKRPASLRK